jgi:hypothetical protein
MPPRPLRSVLRHSARDLLIGLIVTICIGLALFLDTQATLAQQYTLGLIAWSILLALLRGEAPVVRLQVAVAVLFAWFGEYISSPVLGSYIYRLENLPVYVPPGHGMVYLAAVALGRCLLFQRYQLGLTALALLLGALWSLWGVTLAGRGDAAGAVLFCVFMGFIFFGRAPLIYVAAFFLTSYLELLGTWRQGLDALAKKYGGSSIDISSGGVRLAYGSSLSLRTHRSMSPRAISPDPVCR